MPLDRTASSPAPRAVVKGACPHDCPDTCALLTTVHDGVAIKVQGNPQHRHTDGVLCTKVSRYTERTYHPDRVLQPLRRAGPKGSGRFEPVSWDEALAEIAGRLQAVVASPGPAAILNAHYTGTCAQLGNAFGMRFFNRLGATEIDPDTICNKAGHVALDYVYGTSVDGFDPRTARDSACIVVWGANPSASAPHQHDHWLPESPAKVIVV